MTAGSRFTVLKQLVGDTFRQARASRISAMMLAVTAICVLLCLSVRVSGDVNLHDEDEREYFVPPSPRSIPPALESDPKIKSALMMPAEKAEHEGVQKLQGRMTLAFDAVSFPVSRERSDAVHFLELVLAGGVAGAFGVVMTLVWTAGFVPTFLERGAASVLLAKPIARRQLLLGKYLGVVTFAAFHAALFIGATWLALGMRTRVWDAAYFWCIPLLLVQFAVFYGFSVLLAVLARSTVACVFGSVLFWLLAWGMNYGSVMAHNTGDPQYLQASTVAMADAAYWVFPKPIDSGLILFNAVDARHHFEKPEVFKLLESRRSFSPLWSILSSLAITGVLLGLSVHELEATDY